MESFKIGDTAIYIPYSKVGEPMIILDDHIGTIVCIDTSYIHLRFNKSGHINCILPEGIKHYPLRDENKIENKKRILITI
jgi:hypothetical protein